MTNTIKTNPAYAAIAYRRTIVREMITHLRRQYVGMDGEPKAQLICEEVFQVDAVVPPEEVNRVVEELVDEEAELNLELSRFEFTRKDESAQGRKNKTAKAGRGKGRKKALKASVH
jgi:hypothetical protein